MKLVFDIFTNLEVVSQNKFMFGATQKVYSKKHKRNFSVNFLYSNYRKKWENQLKKAIGEAENKPNNKRFLRVTRHHTGRKFDHSNLVGGCKQIPDLLKGLNYIKDDHPKWFADEYVQVNVGKDGNIGTSIQLYEYEPGFGNFIILGNVDLPGQSRKLLKSSTDGKKHRTKTININSLHEVLNIVRDYGWAELFYAPDMVEEDDYNWVLDFG